MYSYPNYPPIDQLMPDPRHAEAWGAFPCMDLDAMLVVPYAVPTSSYVHLSDSDINPSAAKIPQAMDLSQAF